MRRAPATAARRRRRHRRRKISIGWWKLDGDGADASGGGHNLTIEGNVTAASGRVGTGMKFDGTSCMTVPIWDEARMQGANGVTLMAWISPDPAQVCSSLAQESVMGNGWDYSMGMWCHVNGGRPPVMAARQAGAQTWGYPGGGSNATPGQWSHVAVVWDRSKLMIYQNGQLMIQYPNPGDFANGESLFAIGCMITSYYQSNARVQHFSGAVDEAMLYRRVLSSAEIAAYYTAADPCPHAQLANGTNCNDNDLCTLSDTCSNGTCVGSNPKVCSASDQCHVAGTCAPGTGVCSNPPISGGFVCDGAFPIAYHLSEDVRVSINIYDASGAVVRELLRAVPQQAGDHTMVWDGLDRNGKAAPAGSYSWKLLGTPGLSAQYLAKVGDNYPIGGALSSSGGPGTHNAPFAVASDATGTYVAANGTENIDSALIKLGVDGETRPWSQVLPEPEPVAWDGARSLAVDGGNVFLLGKRDSQHVYVSDAMSGVGLRKFSVEWDSAGVDLSQHADEDLHGATDLDVRNDVLVVAYRAQNAIRWYDPEATGTPSPLDEAAVASPAGVAVGNDGTVFVTTAGGISTLSRTDHTLHSLVPSGVLASPGRLDVDHTTGDLLVYNEGTLQVMRFGANGAWKATYGRAGGRLDGHYVAQDFLAVTDVSADGSGGFYVAEAYSAPRRVAHFASNGALIKEWYGGQPWSSHAAFDPDNPSVLWVSSARSKDLMSRYVMRVVVNYAQKTWTVDSTYRYYDHSDPNSGLDYMHDSGNEQGLFHIYKRAATGVKYFVIEGWPSILRIDEAQSKLIPAAGWRGSDQWNDRNGDGLVQSNELTPYTGSGGTAFHISHVDSDFNHYFVTGSYPCEVRRHVASWTEAGAPIYPSDVSGELFGNCPMRFADGGYSDPRWGAFLFHDTQTNNFYAALNSGGVPSTGAPIFTDSFLQHWNAAGQTTWGVGQRSNAAEVNGFLFLAPTEPGSIYWSLRSLAGVTHGSIVATDYSGGWSGEPAHTYVWDQDGLYVGGIMDNIDLSVAPSFMYACSGEFAHSTLYNAPNGDVYFAGAWENDMRIYKVTGWDNWVRKSGTLSIGTAGQDNTGTGLAATYFDNRDFTDARTVRVDGPINFNWGASIPPGTALTSADTYGVRWLGTVQASYGPKYTGFWQYIPDGTASEGGYHEARASGASVECKFSGDSIQVFGITGPTSGLVNILVDGQIVASNINLATPTRQERSIFDRSSLGGGDHTVTVYSIPVLGPTAGTVDIDHFVASGTTIDDSGLPYTFYVASDDGAQLWVNNACLIYDWTPKSASSERATGPIKLLRNGVPIELSYFKDTGGTATIDLQWSSPVDVKQDVPATALRAATAYPIAEMSSGFQRIDQLDQTTHGAWQGQYGADGHAFGNAFALPSYVSLVPSAAAFHYLPGPETKYLTGAGFGWHCGWYDCTEPNDRIPTTLEFSFSDRDWHRLSLYLMDFPNGVGSISAMDITLTDLGGNVDTRTVNGADFVNGAYVSWNVRGYVKVTATRTPGATGWLGAAAISGAFFDPPIGVTTTGMLVSGNGRPIPDGANTPDPVNGTDFGQVAAGAFVDRTYTIANMGTVPLSLTNGVQVIGAQSSEFTVVTAPAPQVANGGSTTLTIRFQPLASGPRSARISLSNSSDKSPYDFAVQGTGGP